MRGRPGAGRGRAHEAGDRMHLEVRRPTARHGGEGTDDRDKRLSKAEPESTRLRSRSGRLGYTYRGRRGSGGTPPGGAVRAAFMAMASSV